MYNTDDINFISSGVFMVLILPNNKRMHQSKNADEYVVFHDGKSIEFSQISLRYEAQRTSMEKE